MGAAVLVSPSGEMDKPQGWQQGALSPPLGLKGKKREQILSCGKSCSCRREAVFSREHRHRQPSAWQGEGSR